jgi:hypothetical protein
MARGVGQEPGRDIGDFIRPAGLSAGMRNSTCSMNSAISMKRKIKTMAPSVRVDRGQSIVTACAR